MQTNMHVPTIKSEDKGDCSRTVRPSTPLNIPRDCEPSTEAFNAVVDDLIHDVILDFCFQVHPASKIGLFKADDDNEEIPTEDIFGQVKGRLKLCNVDCPYCNRKIEATRFANHLEKCGTGRRNKKKMNFDTVGSDFDDDDVEENENDVSYNSSGRKRPKKKNLKNVARKKVNRDPSSEFSGNIQPPHNNPELFLSQYCGVKSKHTKKMCMNTLKCAQHSHEQKQEIRKQLISSNFLNQSQSKLDDVQIDVDTVDEPINRVYMRQSISGNSTPDLNEYSE